VSDIKRTVALATASNLVIARLHQISTTAPWDDERQRQHRELAEVRQTLDTMLLESADQIRLSALEAENERLRADAERLRKHPFAPERCPVCSWTNINLMNYGTTGESRWMCHGCAATALSDLARVREECEHWKGLSMTALGAFEDWPDCDEKKEHAAVIAELQQEFERMCTLSGETIAVFRQALTPKEP
jgi:hypothetical protein